MAAFEVGDLRLVAGLNQGLKARLDEGRHPTTEHALLPEKVGLRLFLEGGLKHPGSGASDALGVSEGPFQGLAGGVLLHRYQTGHPGPPLVFPAHQMTGAFGGHHGDVHVRRGDDLAEVDVEAVGEHEHLARGKMGPYGLLVDLGLDLVRHQDHDDVGLGAGLLRGKGLKAVGLGLLVASPSFSQAHDDVKPAVPQV